MKINKRKDNAGSSNQIDPLIGPNSQPMQVKVGFKIKKINVDSFITIL